MIPQTIGRYQIKDQLGAGGMGIVYRAYDPHLLRNVALKMLFQGEFRRLSSRKQQEVLDRFQQEANIIASLHHPAIIPVYDFGWENGEPFIVMPLMSGGDLDERLEAGALALDEIVRILDWLAPALDKVHQQNIVHGDLKPSNILFNKENQPCLADFGIARLTEETIRFSQTATPIGTPAYMSPEQARGDKDIDGRSDIYSLGGMLFEMLTGKHPYHRVNSYALLYHHIYEPPPRLDDDDLSVQLPTAYQAIIDCAMAKKKEERYNSASEMVNALKAVRQKIAPTQAQENEHKNRKQASATQISTINLQSQGMAAHNKDSYSQAIADYSQVIRLNPNDAEAYIDRGNAYKNKGDYDHAIADYDHAIRLNPNDATLYNRRGNAYYSKRDYDHAITNYSQAIRLNPNEAIYYNNRGLAYNNKGDYDHAIADYDHAIRLNPNDALAYYNRGLAYKNKGDNDQAIADNDQAIRLNPNYVDAYIVRGNAYKNKGHYDQAIADYDHAIRLNPDYALAYHNRGIAYNYKGDYDHAIADYNEAIRLNPNYATAYYNRGLAYYNKGDYDHAIADYEQAIRLNPDDALAYNSRGNAYYNKGNYDQAIADYNEAIRLNPDYATAYNNRGLAYYNKDDYSQAIADYSQAIRLNPDYARAYKNRANAYKKKASSS